MKKASGDLEDALAGFLRSRVIFSRLCERDSGNYRLLRELAVALLWTGVMEGRLKRADAAIASLEQARDKLRDLTSKDRANVMCRRELALALSELAELYCGSGSLESGVEAASDALTRRKELASLDPSNMQWQIECTASLIQLAGMQSGRLERKKSLGLIDQALQTLTRLEANGMLDSEGRLLKAKAIRVGKELGKLVHSKLGSKSRALLSKDLKKDSRRKLVKHKY